MQHLEFESEFGKWRMTFSEPPVDLRPYVDSFYETIGPVAYGHEKIVPRGTAELMVNLGPPHYVLDNVSCPNPAVHRHVWIAGLHTRPLYTAPLHGNGKFVTHFVGASLRPTGIRELLQVDAVETVNNVIELEDIVGTKASALFSTVAAANTTQGRFSALSRFLRAQRAGRSFSASAAASYAARRTISEGGAIRVSDLYGELGVSRKHLVDMYKTTIGVSPKTFARLIRFRRVMESVETAGTQWCKIAADRGFFDQSHMIADFCQFAGETPFSFLQNRAPDGESVNYSDCPELESTQSMTR